MVAIKFSFVLLIIFSIANVAFSTKYCSFPGDVFGPDQPSLCGWFLNDTTIVKNGLFRFVI